MKIKIVAVGTRMPDWVTQASHDFIKRMPRDYQVQLIEVPAVKRDKHTNIQSALTKEAEALLAKCGRGAITVALDRLGQELATQQIASKLESWHDQSQDINLLIGGPEGIDEHYLKQSDQIWSLSKLTLPHPMVRVLVTEQLYRAVSIINNHPYHR